jgi:hypothetical protein
MPKRLFEDNAGDRSQNSDHAPNLLGHRMTLLWSNVVVFEHCSSRNARRPAVEHGHMYCATRSAHPPPVLANIVRRSLHGPCAPDSPGPLLCSRAEALSSAWDIVSADADEQDVQQVQ